MKILFYGISISLLILLGCSHQQNEVDEHELEGHEHEGEEPSFKYSAYSPELEVFVEASHMVAGEESEILAHFTKLSDFSPVKEGKVTATLFTGTSKTSEVAAAPERPGIYHFQLHPGKAGTGRLEFSIEAPDGNFLISVSGVEVFSDEHDAENEAGEAVINNPNAIAFTKEQSWKVDFATGTPEYRPFGSVIKTTALVSPAQGDEVIVTAQTSGIVVFNKDLLVPGTPVSKNKVLFFVSGEKMADNNMAIRYNEAKNNYEKTKADYDRLLLLADDQIISQRELLRSKTEFENAKAVFENLKANFNEGGQEVSSPVSGYVKHLHVSQGEFVAAGQPILVVAQNKNLFLKAEVQQNYTGQLANLKTATVKPNNSPVLTLEELDGEIVSWGKNISDESYLIPVTLRVKNNQNLFPGSIVDLTLICKATKPVVIIPNSALVEEQGNYFVFAQLTPELFEKREVRLGQTDGISTVVKSGITQEDRIVTRGGILVKLAAVSNNLDPHAGHVH